MEGRRKTDMALCESVCMEIKTKHHWGHRVVSRGRMAPVPVVYPRGFLAVFAAVFGATAPPALGELTLELFPLATLVISALPDATSRLVLTAEVSHDHARPVLHILGVVSNSKLLHEGENINIIGKQVLVFLLAHINWRRGVGILIQKMELVINFQLGDKVGCLEV
jgi:hypothetical protein